MAPDEACEHDMLVLVRWQVEGWPSPSLNSTLSIQTNQPLKPSVTGITGLRRATVSDLRTPTESSRSTDAGLNPNPVQLSGTGHRLPWPVAEGLRPAKFHEKVGEPGCRRAGWAAPEAG